MKHLFGLRRRTIEFTNYAKVLDSADLHAPTFRALVGLVAGPIAQTGTMALRWCAAGMVETSKQFRPVNGHLHLRSLRDTLERVTRPVDNTHHDEDRCHRRLMITGPPPKFTNLGTSSVTALKEGITTHDQSRSGSPSETHHI